MKIKNKNRSRNNELQHFILPIGLVIAILYGLTIKSNKNNINGNDSQSKVQNLDSLKNETTKTNK